VKPSKYPRCPTCSRPIRKRRCPPCKGASPLWGTEAHTRWFCGILATVRHRLYAAEVWDPLLHDEARAWVLRGAPLASAEVLAALDGYEQTWMTREEEAACIARAVRDYNESTRRAWLEQERESLRARLENGRTCVHCGGIALVLKPESVAEMGPAERLKYDTCGCGRALPGGMFYTPPRPRIATELRIGPPAVRIARREHLPAPSPIRALGTRGDEIDPRLNLREVVHVAQLPLGQLLGERVAVDAGGERLAQNPMRVLMDLDLVEPGHAIESLVDAGEAADQVHEEAFDVLEGPVTEVEHRARILAVAVRDEHLAVLLRGAAQRGLGLLQRERHVPWSASAAAPSASTAPSSAASLAALALRALAALALRALAGLGLRHDLLLPRAGCRGATRAPRGLGAVKSSQRGTDASAPGRGWHPRRGARGGAGGGPRGWRGAGLLEGLERRGIAAHHYGHHNKCFKSSHVDPPTD
jgi:hypothetical protein